jgi:hypothetical protein
MERDGVVRVGEREKEGEREIGGERRGERRGERGCWVISLGMPGDRMREREARDRERERERKRLTTGWWTYKMGERKGMLGEQFWYAGCV